MSKAERAKELVLHLLRGGQPSDQHSLHELLDVCEAQIIAERPVFVANQGVQTAQSVESAKEEVTEKRRWRKK